MNWLRKEVAAKRREMDDAELVKHLQSPFVSNARPAFLDDDDLLFPFLPEDALLPALCADIHGGSDNDETSAAGKGASSRGDELEEEVSRLREQLAMQQELIQQTKATLLNDGACPSNVTTLESTLKRFSQGRPRATCKHAYTEAAARCDRLLFNQACEKKGVFSVVIVAMLRPTFE